MAIITDIIQTKKDKGQIYQLFVDGESVGLYHIEILIKNGIKVGNEIELNELKTILDQSSIVIAMEKTLNLISKTMKTKQEVVKYLLDKGFNSDVANRVIEKLNEYNYINDEMYCKVYANFQNKKSGKKKIKYDLIKKGVDEKIIEGALENYEEDLSVIENLALKYLKNKQKDYKTKTKLFSHLASKGFDFENINKVINEFNWSENSEDWL